MTTVFRKNRVPAVNPRYQCGVTQTLHWLHWLVKVYVHFTQMNNAPSERSKQDKDMAYDTLCLAGTSSKALLTLGALQMLQDKNELSNIKHFLGTSAGCIISYFLIIGYSPVELLCSICVNQIFEKMKHLNVVAMVNGTGAASWSKLQETLEKMTIRKIGFLPTLGDILDKFDKTLSAVTYNLTLEKTEVLSSVTHPTLPVLVALRMTANMPFVFENFEYNSNHYIDGGVGNNFPLAEAESMGKRVLAICVRSGKSNFAEDSFVQFFYRVLTLPMTQASNFAIERTRENTKVVTLKTSKKYMFFDFNFSSGEKLDLFSSGYGQMNAAIRQCPTTEVDEGTAEENVPLLDKESSDDGEAENNPFEYSF